MGKDTEGFGRGDERLYGISCAANHGPAANADRAGIIAGPNKPLPLPPLTLGDSNAAGCGPGAATETGSARTTTGLAAAARWRRLHFPALRPERPRPLAGQHPTPNATGNAH